VKEVRKMIITWEETKASYDLLKFLCGIIGKVETNAQLSVQPPDMFMFPGFVLCILFFYCFLQI
jgi:hypothetical protein